MAFNPSMTWTLHDKVTKKLNVMTNSTSRLDKALDRTFKNGNASMSRMFATAKGFVIGQGVIGGLNRITSSIREMSNEWVSFDENAYFASAKWNEVTEGTISFNDALQQTKDISREVGAATRFTAGDVAASMDVMAMSGYSLAESNAEVMLGIGKFATLARKEMPEATTMVTSAMAAFGKDITEINSFGDKMTNTFTNSRMELEDLAEATQKAGAIFHSLGQSEFVFNALAMQLAKVKIVGEEAGTKLRNVISVLSSKKKTRETLGSINIDFYDPEGRARNLIEVLAELKEKTSDLTMKKQATLFRNLFNLRDITSARVLIDGIGGSLDEFYEMQFKHAGKMDTQFGRVSGSIAEKWHNLVSALTEKVFGTVETGRSPLSGFLDETIESVRGFDMTAINKWVSENVPGAFKWVKDTVVELMPEIIFLTRTFANLTAKVIEFSPQIVKAVDALLKLGAVMWVGNVLIGIVGNTKLFITVLIELWGYLQYAGVAVQYWIAGLGTVGSTILGVASGIGIAIAAVVAIIAVWKSWGDEITSWWDRVKYSWFIPLTGALGIVFDIIVRSLNMWKRIVTGFSENGIVGSLQIIGKTIVSQLLTPLDLVLKAMDKFGVLGDGMYDSFARFRAGLEDKEYKKEQIALQKSISFTADPLAQSNFMNTGMYQEPGMVPQTPSLVAPNQNQVMFEKQQVEVLVNLKGETEQVDSVSSVGGEVAINDQMGLNR